MDLCDQRCVAVIERASHFMSTYAASMSEAPTPSLLHVALSLVENILMGGYCSSPNFNLCV